MGLWSRLKMILGMKVSRTLDRVENPTEVVDYAYEQQQELLRRVRQGLIEVATSKRQLEHQVGKLTTQVGKLEERAEKALKLDREDLARLAVRRKQTALGEIEGLQQQVAEVGVEETRLVTAEQELSARIEEFRTRRQVMTARYSAANAQVNATEAITGVSGEFAEISRALGRAEEKTERMQARASAIGQLIEIGTLALPGDAGADVIDSELRELSVEDELASMKATLALDNPSILEDHESKEDDDVS